MDVRRFVEIIIGTFVLLIIGSGIFFVLKSRNSGAEPGDTSQSYKLEGKLPVPYFIVAVDKSKSMNFKDSDPNNYEKEALKLIVHMLYFNRNEISGTAQYPKIKLLQYSGNAGNLTDNDDWLTIGSEKDVDALDRKIDLAMENRTGMFTDFNVAINMIKDIAKTVPQYIGTGVNQRPTATISIILTDGALDPNFINPINQANINTQNKLRLQTISLLEKIAGKEFAEKIENILDKEKQVDPIIIAKQDLNEQTSSLVLKDYYKLVRQFGINNPEIMAYARNDVQVQLRSALKNELNSPFQLNMLGLLSGPQHEEDIQYLQNWTRGMGFFYHVKDAGSLGEVFLNTLSKQINAFTDSLTVRGEKTIGPLGADVIAANLTLSLPYGFPLQDKDKFIQLISPTGKIVPSKLNQNLSYSLMFNVSSKDYVDFHQSPGWTIRLTPIITSSGNFNSAICYWTTIHDYFLDVREVTDKANPNKELYSVKLRSQKTQRYLNAKDFDQPMKIQIIATTGEDKFPVSYVKTTGDSVVVDFSGWSAGKHLVRFELKGGTIKGTLSPLSSRFTDSIIEIGNKISVFSDGKTIEQIRFDALDRKNK
jgi:hypothetical protein